VIRIPLSPPFSTNHLGKREPMCFPSKTHHARGSIAKFVANSRKAASQGGLYSGRFYRINAGYS
jgi:hypothetical protein